MEEEFVRTCIIALEGVLGYFEARVRGDGFVGHVDTWNMVDRQVTWDKGEPPALVAGDHLSQHSQIMAILSGAATPEQVVRIEERIVDDDTLYRTQPMQRYYLARALEKIGKYDRFPDSVLGHWYTMLDLRLSTWAEYIPGGRD